MSLMLSSTKIEEVAHSVRRAAIRSVIVRSFVMGKGEGQTRDLSYAARGNVGEISHPPANPYHQCTC